MAGRRRGDDDRHPAQRARRCLPVPAGCAGRRHRQDPRRDRLPDRGHPPDERAHRHPGSRAARPQARRHPCRHRSRRHARQLRGRARQAAGPDGLADAAEKDREAVEALGAHHIVPRGDDVADKIREIVPDGVDGLVDGSVQDEQVIPAVRDGGGIATVRFWKGIPTRDITFHRVSVGHEYHSGDKLDRLRQLAEEGVIPLKVAGVYPAEEAAEAHRRFEEGGVRGRLVIDLSGL